MANGSGVRCPACGADISSLRAINAHHDSWPCRVQAGINAAQLAGYVPVRQTVWIGMLREAGIEVRTYPVGYTPGYRLDDWEIPGRLWTAPHCPAWAYRILNESRDQPRQQRVAVLRAAAVGQHPASA